MLNWTAECALSFLLLRLVVAVAILVLIQTVVVRSPPASAIKMHEGCRSFWQLCISERVLHAAAFFSFRMLSRLVESEDRL